MTDVLTQRTPVPDGSPIGVRVRSVMSASTLDRSLLAGADPDADPILAHRVARLTSRASRRRLAVGLRRAAQDTPAGARSSRAPTNRAAVHAARCELLALADDLDSERTVHARGVLLTRRLLSDVTGPLFLPADVGDLATAASEARRALR